MTDQPPHDPGDPVPTPEWQAQQGDRDAILARAEQAERERDALKLALDIVVNEPNKAKVKRLISERDTARAEGRADALREAAMRIVRHERGTPMHSPPQLLTEAHDAILALIDTPSQSTAAPDALVRAALEWAATLCDAERDRRNRQRRDWTGSGTQGQRWIAGAMQAAYLADEIRTAASDPATIAAIIKTAQDGRE